MRFVKESRITASPAEVFAFHESPGAFEKLTPPWAPVEVVEGGGSIRPGTRVVLRLKVGPVPITWVAVHEEYDPPHLFTDRQEAGPFAAWHHRHVFLDDGRGGTLLRDEVEFQPPGGALGRWLGAAAILRNLEKMFGYRHETIRKLMETNLQSPERIS